MKSPNRDTQKNKDNFNNYEKLELSPKIEIINDNNLENEKKELKSKTNSLTNIKKKNNKILQNNKYLNSDLSDIIKNKEKLALNYINIIPIVKDGELLL